MRDYTDLVKRLNEYSAEHEMHGGITAEAADAIEELIPFKKQVEKGMGLLDKADELLNAVKPRWIPVAERLPEHEYGESTSVLTVDLYGVMRVTYFDGGNWCWPTGEALTTMRVAPITHWMPLPEPPDAPTVDAVPVVRCKDCKHYQHDAFFDHDWCDGRRVTPDYYCADGERRSDG